jgi:hypothetical protein
MDVGAKMGALDIYRIEFGGIAGAGGVCVRTRGERRSVLFFDDKGSKFSAAARHGEMAGWP